MSTKKISIRIASLICVTFFMQGAAIAGTCGSEASNLQEAESLLADTTFGSSEWAAASFDAMNAEAVLMMCLQNQDKKTDIPE
jgi:hypothetical protein